MEQKTLVVRVSADDDDDAAAAAVAATCLVRVFLMNARRGVFIIIMCTQWRMAVWHVLSRIVH